MKALEKLREISKKLSHFNIEDNAREAELLLGQGLGIDLVEIYRDNPEINIEQAELIEKMIGRRAGREPLQYITGSTDFLGLKIMVGKGVLIPRPETELMAEMAIKQLRITNYELRITDDELRPMMLDLCTGSGCLALALAKNFPNSEVYGTDVSDTALSYAQKNADINEITNVSFLQGDLFGPLGQNMLFDFIISNPPYIRSDDIKGLQPEIVEWEPLSALDGGEDGLDFYRKIIPASRNYLNDNGVLMFEVGFDGADDVGAIFRSEGYQGIHITEDYSEIKRIVFAQWTK